MLQILRLGLFLTQATVGKLGFVSTDMAYLVETWGVSERTIKSWLAQLRHLGMDIRAARDSNGWSYQVANAREILESGRLERWVALEERRLALEESGRLV